MDLGKLTDMAGGMGLDLGKLNLEQIITDKFIKDNTVLDSVQGFLNKVGVGSLLDLKNISGDKLDGIIKSISNFGSWKDFLMKAAGGQIGGGLGDKLGGLFK